MCAALLLIISRQASSLSGEPAWQARRGCSACCGQQRGGLLWRTAKADVGQEIALPPQTHRVTYLTLNAIERHFYMEQHKVRDTPTGVR